MTGIRRLQSHYIIAIVHGRRLLPFDAIIAMQSAVYTTPSVFSLYLSHLLIVSKRLNL